MKKSDQIRLENKIIFVCLIFLFSFVRYSAKSQNGYKINYVNVGQRKVDNKYKQKMGIYHISNRDSLHKY